MPTYQYICDVCKHNYEEFRSILLPHPEKCPECGEKECFRQVYGEIIGIMKNRPTTFGQQAEINAKRMGKEQVQKMAEEASRRPYSGPLPDGASIETEGNGEVPPWRNGSMGTPVMDKTLDVSKIKDVKKYVETGVG